MKHHQQQQLMRFSEGKVKRSQHRKNIVAQNVPLSLGLLHHLLSDALFWMNF